MKSTVSKSREIREKIRILAAHAIESNSSTQGKQKTFHESINHTFKSHVVDWDETGRTGVVNVTLQKEHMTFQVPEVKTLYSQRS